MLLVIPALGMGEIRYDASDVLHVCSRFGQLWDFLWNFFSPVIQRDAFSGEWLGTIYVGKSKIFRTFAITPF
jgi:hypothetical protein